MCEQYVGTLRMLLKNNATQAEVLAGMKEMCSLMPASVKGMVSKTATVFLYTFYKAFSAIRVILIIQGPYFH